MYDHSSLLIISLLFIALIVATEVGYRIGHHYISATSDSTRSQINTMQASLLGVLALLLGFTFSLSLQRYDSRSQAVISEANAIGTALLRAELLPATVRTETRTLLRQYLDQRVHTGNISLDQAELHDAALRDSSRISDTLWREALRAADQDSGPVTTGLYVQALNELIDAYGTRAAALDRHVPEPVLFLLFGTFALTVCLVGFSSGITGRRAFFPTYVLVLLIVLLVLIIIDLDRPRRGLIEVSQQSLIDLQASTATARIGRDE